jgi:hypothetical protein
MRSGRYIHPEFGYLAPTGRFRRELKVGLLSTLFGVGIGVAAVTALSRDHRGAASGPATSSAVAAAPSSGLDSGGSDGNIAATNLQATGSSTKKVNQPIKANPQDLSRGGANSSGDVKQACQDGDRSCSRVSLARPRRGSVFPTNDPPATARLSLGRSDASSETVQAESQITGLPQAGVESVGAETTPLPRHKPSKIARNQNYPQRKLDDHLRVEPGNISGRTTSATRPASPRGFWAWSSKSHCCGVISCVDVQSRASRGIWISPLTTYPPSARLA